MLVTPTFDHRPDVPSERSQDVKNFRGSGAFRFKSIPESEGRHGKSTAKLLSSAGFQSTDREVPMHGIVSKVSASLIRDDISMLDVIAPELPLNSLKSKKAPG